MSFSYSYIYQIRFSGKMRWKEWFCRWYDTIIYSIRNINIFHSNFAPTTDRYQIETQIIATRIYIVLLAVSLFIFVTYNSQVYVTETVSVKYPMYDQFLSLYRIYPESLSCPCTVISIAYDQFIYLDASYHQVCDSVFTTLAWRHLIDSTANDRQTSLNFHYIGGPMFFALSSFCRLSRTTVTDGIVVFNATQIISATALPLNIFKSETEDLIRSFISKTTQEFARSLEFIRDQIQYNGIMSGLQTNFYYITTLPLWTEYSPGYEFNSVSSVYGDQSSNCSCDNTPFCKIPAFIDDENSFHIPGFYYGCYIVESLLQSHLGCFYNQSCIDELRQALHSSVTLNTTALDSTAQSQYSSNETIQHIVNHLMAEQWTNRTSHELYYNGCRPLTCVYTYSNRKNWLAVLTSIIVPIGGLNIILKIVIPRLIMIFRSRRRPVRAGKRF